MGLYIYSSQSLSHQPTLRQSIMSPEFQQAKTTGRKGVTKVKVGWFEKGWLVWMVGWIGIRVYWLLYIAFFNWLIFKQELHYWDIVFGTIIEDVPPGKSNMSIPKIAIFKGSCYLFKGPSFWGPPGVSFRECNRISDPGILCQLLSEGICRQPWSVAFDWVK